MGIVDIDHFKSVNDLRSHLLGDEVLRVEAGMIREHCRERDICARYGGDEFTLCLVGTNLDDALAVLERLRALIAHHAWSSLHAALAVTVSVGVAEIFEGDTVATLMERVDLALYRAKEDGRDCVVVDASVSRAASVRTCAPDHDSPGFSVKGEAKVAASTHSMLR